MVRRSRSNPFTDTAGTESIDLGLEDRDASLVALVGFESSQVDAVGLAMLDDSRDVEASFWKKSHERIGIHKFVSRLPRIAAFEPNDRVTHNAYTPVVVTYTTYV